MRVEHRQEAEGNAGNGTGVEQHMHQFHVDALQAATQAVHQDRCKQRKGQEEELNQNNQDLQLLYSLGECGLVSIVNFEEIFLTSVGCELLVIIVGVCELITPVNHVALFSIFA